MGQPAQDKSETKSSEQARRDAHYQEDGVTAEHATQGAQYGREGKNFKPNDGSEGEEKPDGEDGED